MSDITTEIAAWRRELVQVNGISADDADELESHLLEELDALQKANLRPEEAFLVATRRLGHPRELAVEYAKSDTLLSWRRPARLVLWGLLFLQLCMFGYGVLAYTALALGPSGPGFQSFFTWTHTSAEVFNWMALGLLFLLATNPQGRLGRFLAACESGLQTNQGAAALVLGMMCCNVAVVALRLLLVEQLNANPQSGFAYTDITYLLFAQLTIPLLLWTLPVVAALIILVRLEPRAVTPVLKTT